MRKDNDLLKTAQRLEPKITPRHRDYTIPPRTPLANHQGHTRNSQGAKP